MCGREITLSIPSVGATENALLTACGCEGVTTIFNAAREPEIDDLQRFLRAMGHQVQGAGTSVVTVAGRSPTHDLEHTVMPDRIVAATYLAAVAAAGGEVELKGVDYRHLSTVIAALHEAGCRIHSTGSAVLLRSTGELKGVRPIRTAPYPGFPTDMQPQIAAILCIAAGTSVLTEGVVRFRSSCEMYPLESSLRSANSC